MTKKLCVFLLSASSENHAAQSAAHSVEDVGRQKKTPHPRKPFENREMRGKQSPQTCLRAFKS